VPTLERSILDQIVPARDVGAMIHGQKLFGDALTSPGRVQRRNQWRRDSNNHRTSRAVWPWRPLNSDEFWCSVTRLQLGWPGPWALNKKSGAPATLRTPTIVPWLQFNRRCGPTVCGRAWSPEVGYFWNSLGFRQPSTFTEEQKLRPSSTVPPRLPDRSATDGF